MILALYSMLILWGIFISPMYNLSLLIIGIIFHTITIYNFVMCYLSDPGIIPRNHPEYKKIKNNSKEEIKERMDSEKILIEEKNKNSEAEKLESLQNEKIKVINNTHSEFKKNIDRDNIDKDVYDYNSKDSKDSKDLKNFKDSKKKKVITLFNTGEDDPIFGTIQSKPLIIHLK